MDQPNSPDITTGNTPSKIPILASAEEAMAEGSKPSQPPTSIESASIETVRPVSIPEALSLLQTLCLDLRTLKCETAILADKRMIYFMVEIPASIGLLTVTPLGHVALNNVPVSVFDTGTKRKA